MGIGMLLFEFYLTEFDLFKSKATNLIVIIGLIMFSEVWFVHQLRATPSQKSILEI